VTITVTTAVEPTRQAGLAARIHALSLAEPKITPRPVRSLRRALRGGRLVVAEDGARVVGWFLSEPCGRGVHELGFLFVDSSVRGDDVLLRMLDAGLALDRRAVAVTFRAGFAEWLVGSRAFRRSSLGEVTRLSRGFFILRRLAPRRLAAALRRTSASEAFYLVHEGER